MSRPSGPSSSSSSDAPNTAFRSFWTAPKQAGTTQDMYDYQPNYQAQGQSGQGTYNNPRPNIQNTETDTGDHDHHGHSHGPGDEEHGHSHGVGRSHEDAPLLSHSGHTHTRTDNRRKIFYFFSSYGSCLFCLILLILFLLLIFYLIRSYRSHHGVIGGTGGIVSGAPSPSPSIAPYCNPFAFIATGVDLHNDHGIVAQLYTLPSDYHETATTTEDYEKYAQHSNITFFFSSLDTPTRLFTQGFQAKILTHNTNNQDTGASSSSSSSSSDDDSSSSSSSRRDDGVAHDAQLQVLPSQYFLMKFSTRLQSPVKRERGVKYQFALISDDGSVLSEEQEDADDEENIHRKVIVDNDGIHCTRMAVSRHRLALPSSRSDSVPVSVYYFQGPPAHIALQMLYRPWKKHKQNSSSSSTSDSSKHEDQETSSSSSRSSSDADDSETDLGDNDRYWSVGALGVPSRPNERYTTLLSQGWKVVPEDWFWLPKHYPGQEQVQQLLTSDIDPCSL